MVSILWRRWCFRRSWGVVPASATPGEWRLVRARGSGPWSGVVGVAVGAGSSGVVTTCWGRRRFRRGCGVTLPPDVSGGAWLGGAPGSWPWSGVVGVGGGWRLGACPGDLLGGAGDRGGERERRFRAASSAARRDASSALPLGPAAPGPVPWPSGPWPPSPGLGLTSPLSTPASRPRWVASSAPAELGGAASGPSWVASTSSGGPGGSAMGGA